MINTFILFEDRTKEIEFYYSIMSEIDSESDNIRTIDNKRLLRILKSNFLLMVYNLVEACVVSGMLEIYEKLKNSGSTYGDLISEIQSIWSNYEIGKVYSNIAGRAVYEDRVQSIITQVITSQPLALNKDSLGISGNLDARAIKKLCDKHRIRYVAADNDGCLRVVKEKRNNLAHGDESFGDCARDMSLSDLEHIKDEVISFISGILDGMKDYSDNTRYLSI
ncbi:MAE_28990/MAE_18760 family HEPN-like nuclease [Paenibacillus sp. FSL M7-0656]|uniref:MAE_28990/MAE_18760 family HEPN-like nuclease n=1 Tax=Paenibacillus sp. FSL M7-0656 TaxID=2921534 RepID=UPI0030F634FF